VVVSHPFLGPGQKGKSYEVLELSTEGSLAQTGKTFSMRTATSGEIAFTPDGKLGFVAQEDGTLGVFSLSGVEPSVLHEGYDPGTYVSRVVVGPEGDRLYLLNNQWRENGGGVYTVKIGCDDGLTPEGLLAPAKLPAALVFLPGKPGEALLAAVDVLDSKAGNSAHLLALASKAQKGGADAFGDSDAIVSSAAVTRDGLFGLLADNSEFSGKPNRVAVVGLGSEGVSAVQVLTPINDPFSLLASPFDNRILVASSYGNALLSFSFHPVSSSAPFSSDGPLAYLGKKPQLPGDMVMIRRGKLTGRVLLTEVDGVRQVQFSESGAAPQDLGLFDLQGSTESIPGAIGVQP
jgi:DNA-binding beta-propeller fold protein YncE